MYYLWKCRFWEMKYHDESWVKSNHFTTNDEAYLNPFITSDEAYQNHFITSDEAKPSHELWNDFDMPSHELWKDLDLPSHEFWNFISQKQHFHKFHIKNFTTCCFFHLSQIQIPGSEVILIAFSAIVFWILREETSCNKTS